ncbi:GumC family protein [Acidomonas methanolica]|uniref:GumC family protein n=1 Tax=Acidomonas methanolica TaxID=437 RepID=UPI001C05E4B5|nr:polysaccharide biosynthesis tyrosine autokinase [Acidomonas methanolica]MBU2654165.1 polysaccharide biosynthesis tyrosine autokinase [Acidomonas methanolica]
MNFTQPSLPAAPMPVGAHEMLHRALGIGRRHYRLFAAVFLAVMFVGTGLIMLLPRSYQSVATIVVSRGIMDPLNSQSMSANAQELGDDEIATQAELIQSRDVAAAVLRKLPPAPKPRPGVRTWLCGHHVAFFCPKPSKTPVDPAVAFDQQISALLASVDVEPKLHSRILTITVKDHDAHRAAAIADQFVMNYQNLALAEQRSDLSKTLSWLDERTASLRKRWVEAETAASLFNGSHNLTNTSANAPLINQQIANAAAALGQAQGRYAAAQAKADALKEALGTGNERDFVSLGEQPLLVSVANALMQLSNQRTQLAATYGANHPSVQAIDRQIAQTRSSLDRETRAALARINDDVIATRAEILQTQRNLDTLRAQSAKQSGPQAEYATLAQEAQSAQGVYDSFLERTKELAGRVQLLQPPVAFVSHAAVASAPTFPNRKKLLIGVFVIALVCGVAAIILRDMLSPGFGDLTEISHIAALPVLARLPDISRERSRSASRYIMDNPFSEAGEAVRGISAQIALSNSIVMNRSRVLAITSAAPSEGRSTLAVWLASIMRAGNQPVLIIDTDHRANKGDRSPPGFTDIMGNRITAQDAIVTNPLTGIDVIGPGTPQAHPFDSREIARLRATLDELGGLYDLIIIDTPPLLSATDGLVFASVADQTIFLCRWSSVSRSAVSTCLERLRTYRASLAGIVVNYFSGSAAAIARSDDPQKEVRLIDHLGNI